VTAQKVARLGQKILERGSRWKDSGSKSEEAVDKNLQRTQTKVRIRRKSRGLYGRWHLKSGLIAMETTKNLTCNGSDCNLNL